MFLWTAKQHFACIVAVWSTCSVGLVVFNKIVMHELNFNHPMFLTWLHCVSVSSVLFIVCDVLSLLPSIYQNPVAGAVWTRVIPVASLFAASTWMRNAAYVHLPISLIQILAGTGPPLTYIMSSVLGLETWNPKLGSAVAVMFAGVFIASFRGVSASAVGIALQSGGILLEVMRGILLKRIFLDFEAQHVNFLDVLYLSTPVSMALLAVPMWLWDARPSLTQLKQADARLAVALGVNIVLAVGANFASYLFIKSCSNTTASVTDASKDAVLILGSLLLFQGASPANARTFLGYLISLTGTLSYMLVRESLAKNQGLYTKKSVLQSGLPRAPESSVAVDRIPAQTGSKKHPPRNMLQWALPSTAFALSSTAKCNAGDV